MEESTAELVQRLRPVIEILLTSHGVPQAEGQKLLEDLVRALEVKRESIVNPEAWLIASLHRAVQRAETLPPREDDRDTTLEPRERKT